MIISLNPLDALESDRIVIKDIGHSILWNDKHVDQYRPITKMKGYFRNDSGS
jgi:hypothetical protein